MSCRLINALSKYMICLLQVEASLPTKCTRLHGKPHPSELSRIRQLAFPEASKNNNGLSVLIHCIVRKLCVPAYLPARRPQRKTNANDPSCVHADPSYPAPLSTAPRNFSPTCCEELSRQILSPPMRVLPTKP